MTLDRNFVWETLPYDMGGTMFVCLEGHPNTKMKLTGDPARLKYYALMGDLEINPSFTSVDRSDAIVLTYSKGDEDSIKFFEYLASLKLPNKPTIIVCIDENLESPIIEDLSSDDSSIHYFEGSSGAFLEDIRGLVKSVIDDDITVRRNHRRKFVDTFIEPDPEVHLEFSPEKYKEFAWFETLRKALVSELNADLNRLLKYNSKRVHPRCTRLCSDRDILAIIDVLSSAAGTAELRCSVAPFEVSQTEASECFIRAVLGDVRSFSDISKVFKSDSEEKNPGFYTLEGLLKYTEIEKFLKKLTKKDSDPRRPYRCMSLLEMTALKYGSFDRLKYSLDHFSDGVVALDDGHNFYFDVTGYRNIQRGNFISKKGYKSTVISGRPSPDLIYGLNELHAEWLEYESSNRYFKLDQFDEEYYTALKIQLYAFVIGHFENAKFVSENHPTRIHRYLSNILRSESFENESRKNPVFSGGTLFHFGDSRDGYTSGGGLTPFAEQGSLLRGTHRLSTEYPVSVHILTSFFPVSKPDVVKRAGALRVARSI